MEQSPWLLALASIIVTIGLQAAKALAPKFAAAPDWVKMVVGAIVAGVVTFGQAITGKMLNGDPLSWNTEVWQTIMTWVMAMGIHAFGKKAVSDS